MKRRFTALVCLVLVLMVSNVPLYAHHGRGSTYDSKREIALKGVVSQLSWRNPHVTIYVDVKGDDGKVTTWVIEHSNISQLARLGYGRNTLQVGMPVTAYVNPGSKGEPIGLCQKFILPDGKEVFQRDNLPANLRRGAAGLVID